MIPIQQVELEGGAIFDVVRAYRYIVADLAFTEGKRSDYTALTAWAWDGQHYVLLDVDRDRMPAPETLRRLQLLHDRWRAQVVWVEAVAAQLAIVQFARDMGLPVRPCYPDGDKVSRAMAATPAFSNGKVFIPRNAPWVATYETELLSFPSSHDDLVDVTSYAIAYCGAGRTRRAWIPNIPSKPSSGPADVMLNSPADLSLPDKYNSDKSDFEEFRRATERY